MKKLCLYDLQYHLYQNKYAAAAYIYFSNGSDKFPRDHRGVKMGNHYQEPFELEAYLNSKVTPVVKAALAKSDYQLECIEFVNQAPFPFFKITHKENKEVDLEVIRKLLEAGIKEEHKKLHAYNLRKSTLFPKVAATEQDKSYKTSFKKS